MNAKKKSLNRKEVAVIIKSKLQEGIARQEILNELSEQYYSKSTIATMIASTIDPQAKEKYKALNNLLLALLVLSAIAKLLLGIAVLSSLSPLLIPFAILFPFISIVLAIEVYKYSGHIYGIVSLFSFGSILRTFANFTDLEFDGYFDIAVLLVIALLALYLKDKMLPHYGFLGPKKDSEGNYILG